MDEIHKTASHACVDTNVHKAVHKRNYHLLVIFHTDVENRPCRPVLQVVHFTTSPETLTSDIPANPKGVEIVTTCQLCDPCTNSPTSFRVDTQRILCICSASITDIEASRLINNVSKIYNHASKSGITLTQRSNFAVVPRWAHKFLKLGKSSIADLDNMSTATDVQLAILLIIESVDNSRSIWSRVQTLHPVMSTPENLHETISDFTRRVDLNSFKCGAFKYTSEYDLLRLD